MWGTTCPVIYVVDSDQVAKLHLLKTAPNSYIYSIQSSSDIVQDPTRVSRTVCVCGWMCRQLQGKVHICTEVAIYRVLEWSQHRTRSWESCSLNVSMHSASVTSFGMTFHRRVPSGKIPRMYAKVGAYGTRNWALPFLLLAGACMMWSNARMSTRPWTILYIMVMRAFARRSARGSKPKVFRMAEMLLVWP